MSISVLDAGLLFRSHTVRFWLAHRRYQLSLSHPDPVAAAIAPVDFIPKRLPPIVIDGGLPSRPAWECALMLKLQEELKSGNISVGNSKRFGRFDDYFLHQEQWTFRRDTFFQRSGLPSDPTKTDP